eukprot:1136161-Pelagomonas_calceolata.AAC.2
MKQAATNVVEFELLELVNTKRRGNLIHREVIQKISASHLVESLGCSNLEGVSVMISCCGSCCGGDVLRDCGN